MPLIPLPIPTPPIALPLRLRPIMALCLDAQATFIVQPHSLVPLLLLYQVFHLVLELGLRFTRVEVCCGADSDADAVGGV